MTVISRSPRLGITLAIFGALLLNACSTGKRLSTDWLTTGSTTRSAVKQRYGEPAEYYENGRILAYRINRKSREFNGYDESFTLNPPGSVRENLIFTFDENGILTSISRIDLRD